MRRRKNRYIIAAGRRTPRNPVTRDADGIDRITFDSVGEAVIDSMADYAQNEGTRQFIAARLAGHMDGTDDWANFYTKERLLAAIAKPPQHLMDAVDQMRQSLVEALVPPTCSRRRVLRNQEFGDELTPEAVLVRSLSPWERMSRENQPRRSVTIGVNLTVNCAQRAEHLLWRGAAAAALADILSQRGLNVEIVAFWSLTDMSDTSRKVVAKYIIKRADMPLDLGAVALALAEIAFARLVALYGLARHMEGRVSESLGHCERLPAVDRRGLDYVAETDIASQWQAEAWLRSVSTETKTQESEYAHV